KGEEDAADVIDELCDRFAGLPEAAGNLIKIARIKALAQKCGVASITEKNGAVTLFMAKNWKFSAAKLSALFQKYRRQALFSPGEPPYIVLRPEARQGVAAGSALGSALGPALGSALGAAPNARLGQAQGAAAAAKPAASSADAALAFLSDFSRAL
ncbi:MAG: hypothetical protein LBJ10_06655, partial [Clostridiales bacterium]|nr:hypothetical protein [Clostridiales bacterium]